MHAGLCRSQGSAEALSQHSATPCWSDEGWLARRLPLGERGGNERTRQRGRSRARARRWRRESLPAQRTITSSCLHGQNNPRHAALVPRTAADGHPRADWCRRTGFGQVMATALKGDTELLLRGKHAMRLMQKTESGPKVHEASAEHVHAARA